MTCSHRCLWLCYARALQMLKHQSNDVGQKGKSHFWQKSETSASVETKRGLGRSPGIQSTSRHPDAAKS